MLSDGQFNTVTASDLSANRMRRRRERARAQGLCSVCCSKKAPETRRICSGCNAAATTRMGRLYERRRRERRVRAEMQAVETVGDNAMARFEYFEASIQYKWVLRQKPDV